MNWKDEARKWVLAEAGQLEPEVMERLARLVESWIDTSARYAANAEYYLGLLKECAEYLGPEAFTDNGGVVYDQPIPGKIPELVARLVAELGKREEKQPKKFDLGQILYHLRRLQGWGWRIQFREIVGKRFEVQLGRPDLSRPTEKGMVWKGL